MMVMVQELGLLLVLVLVAILTYSSLVYFAERDVKVLDDKDNIVSPSKLRSIQNSGPLVVKVPVLKKKHL